MLGTAVGLVSGYFGGSVDSISSWFVNVVVAFPFYVLIIALVFVLGSGTRNIYIAIALVGWVSYTRIVRGEVLVVKRREYVLAARTAGLSSLRILRRHVLPNVITQAIVYAMSDIVLVILAIVTLGYLGLGVQPPTPDWGRMIADGQPYLTTNWELATSPGSRSSSPPSGWRSSPTASPTSCDRNERHDPRRARPARGVPARARPRARGRRRLLRPPSRRGARARRRIRLREDDGVAGARRPSSRARRASPAGRSSSRAPTSLAPRQRTCGRYAVTTSR